MQHSIGTIINYCTNDYRFLKLCIENAKQISSQIIISVCDHFFDGTPENRELLNRSYQEHPDCTFIEFAYDPSNPYGLNCPFKPDDDDWAHYWHSTGRYVGFQFLDEKIEHVLFLDVDEIVDGARFNTWLETSGYRDHNAARFYSNFYFRTPEYRAVSPALNALLVKKEAITSGEMLLTALERKGTFDLIEGRKLNYVADSEGVPLIDHYSWVRTKEELLLKVSTWGHHAERDWTSLVEAEFARPFTGTEEVFGLRYEKVEPRFEMLSMEKGIAAISLDVMPKDVRKIDSRTLEREMVLRAARIL